MNSLSVVGRKANIQVISVTQSLSLCTKIKEKSQTAPTIKGSLCSQLQEKSLLLTEDHLPKTLLVPSQHKHHRHGVHPQTAPRDMPGAEQRTVCSVCGPDQNVWQSEKKGIVDNHGVPWLPQHGYPTAQRPMQPS